MFPKQTLRSVEVAGKKVLVRVDFNVPLDSGKVRDDSRIVEAIPTIEFLRAAGAKIILLSHLGRPGGQFDRSLQLDPVAARLSELLDQPVKKVDDCVGPRVAEAVDSLEPGQITLLENLRFYPGEEANDAEFAKSLAQLGEIYVLDAFSVAHRAHASTVGLARILPGVGGLSLEREYEVVSGFLEHPSRPFWAIVGGAKVSTKIGVLRKLLSMVDGLILGGAMANTFLKAQGKEIGASVFESGSLGEASQVLEDASRSGRTIILPVDSVVGISLEANETEIKKIDDLHQDDMLLDIGPESVKAYQQALAAAGQVIWNGPLGYAENPRFGQGTFQIAETVTALEAKSLIAGADTVAAITNLGFRGDFTYVSTGGGATLEFMENGHLPGIDALRDKQT
jgi:phosphoglycerate kinase